MVSGPWGLLVELFCDAGDEEGWGVACVGGVPPEVGNERSAQRANCRNVNVGFPRACGRGAPQGKKTKISLLFSGAREGQTTVRGASCWSVVTRGGDSS
jgi:hypothetical protein